MTNTEHAKSEHPKFAFELNEDLVTYQTLKKVEGNASRLLTYSNSIKSFPLPPVLWQNFQDACQREASAAQLAEIIKEDPVLAAAILRTVNTAGFGALVQINDVDRAISRLGTSMVRSIVAQHSFGSSSVSGKAYEVNMLWRHGMAVSVLAEVVAGYIPGCNKSEAGTLGLFHDIGRMSFNLLTEYMMPATLDAEKGHLSYELARFQATHVDLGKVLAEHWLLPDKITRGISYHHHPAYAEPDEIPEDIRHAVFAVYVADILAIQLGFGGGDAGIAHPLDAYADLLVDTTMAELLQDARVQKEVSRIAGLEF